jgi:hypothetical protein
MATKATFQCQYQEQIQTKYSCNWEHIAAIRLEQLTISVDNLLLSTCFMNKGVTLVFLIPDEYALQME